MCQLFHIVLYYHGLRASASPVLTATGFVNGRWQFSTPHRINTPWPITKKFGIGDYVGGPYGCAKFHKLTYRSDPSMDFHAWWLKRRGFAQGCAFWGFRWHCSPFLGWNTPKPPILGAWIGVFKPNVKNTESFMLSKLLHRFQPNFAQR